MLFRSIQGGHQLVISQLLRPPLGMLATWGNVSYLGLMAYTGTMYLLTRVDNTISHDRMSVNASISCDFFIVLFSVPPWSSRTRSRAAIRSSRVSVHACTGESGIQINTAMPTTIANPPKRMNRILYGAKFVVVSNAIP